MTSVTDIASKRRPELPPDRGRLLTVDEVRAMLCGVSRRWVLENVPHRMKLGPQTVRWYEADVRSWLEERRTA